MQQGELYRGFGDTLARAFELTLTPMIFGAGGYGLDRWLGTRPTFTILLALLAVVGLFARSWYSYDRTMRALEASGPWARAALQSGEDRARAALQSGEDRARAALESGEDRAQAALQSGEHRARGPEVTD